MIKNLEIDDSIYQFIDKIPLEKDNVKDLIEYVHYKALLELFTYIIENNNGSDMDFMLPEYIEVISKIKIIIGKINERYEKI